MSSPVLREGTIRAAGIFGHTVERNKETGIFSSAHWPGEVTCGATWKKEARQAME